MTVLKLLARATWAWIITSGQLILNNWLMVLLSAGVVLSCGLLIAVDKLLLTNVLLALNILLALSVSLRSGLLNLLLHLGYTAAGEDRADAVVHLVDHLVPNLGTLELEDKQWILLLVRGILYRVLQLVELAEVLLPTIVDDVEQDALLELLNDALTVGLVSLLEVTRYVEHLATIGDGHHDALVDRTLILVNLLDDRLGYGLDALGAAVEVLDSCLECFLVQLLALSVDILIAGEWNLH